MGEKTGLHREGGGIGLPTLPVGAGGSVHVIFQLSYEEPLLFKPNWGHQGQPCGLCGGVPKMISSTQALGGNLTSQGAWGIQWALF